MDPSPTPLRDARLAAHRGHAWTRRWKQRARRAIVVGLLCVGALAVTGAACDEPAPKDPAPELTSSFKLPNAGGARFADQMTGCVERLTGLAFAVEEQEFGDPWIERDSFVLYDEVRQALHIAMLGSGRNATQAQERIDARRPIIDESVKRCEAYLGAPEGEVGSFLEVSYSRVFRKTGKVRPILTVGKDGATEHDPQAEPIPFWEWLGDRR